MGMELLLPLGQEAAIQDCSVPLILIFQSSLLCNARVCAAEAIPVPGKSELSLTRASTQEKPNPVELWLRAAIQQKQPWKEKNGTKRKIPREIH